jgi:ribose-phosphate pyrophosphokinase
MNKIQIIAGTSHPKLAHKISKLLDVPLTPVEIKNFADGEIYVRIGKKVRGDDVYIIQSLVAPVNDNLMQLLILIDALKRASAKRINLICPYMCYSRQDRKVVSREPITAKLVADLITKSGVDRLITVDLHTDQIQGFYDIPVDHFVGYPQFAKYLKDHHYQDVVVVSPDIGGVKRANKLADLLGAPLAIIDKVRRQHNEAEVAHVVGDVKDKTAVILDDIIDTGGSIAAAAAVLKEFGAKEIIICATHALLSRNASERLEASPASKILLLNSVPIPQEKRTPKVKVISLAPLLSKIISRVHQERSLGHLFTWENVKKVL